MKSHLPILYSFRRCPWAMRARLALAYANQPYEIREVNLRNKPASMMVVSPKGTVPVLILPDGRVIDESYDIMLWAIQQHDPQDWGKVIDHSILHQSLQELLECIRIFKYQEQSDHWQEAKKSCEVWLQNFNDLLTENHFLTDAHCRLVDTAIFPIIRQVSRIDVTWFADLNLEATETWLDYFYNAEFYQLAMQKFPVWAEID